VLSFSRVIAAIARPNLVMPGLDPGIHQSLKHFLSKKMDHRVKPGDDNRK
jgi:hypothetical protein